MGKPGRSARLGNLASIAGALTSVALVVGLGVWGYRLAVRDVTGVPVIRALEGPARIAPDDPGGELARHTGLSVNGVAEDGTAAPPADRLALAPQVAELGEDALPMASLRPMPRASVPLSPQAEAADAALAEPEVAATASLTEDSAPADEAARAAALADDLSDGLAPLEPLDEGAPPPTELLPEALDPDLAADPEAQADPVDGAIAANVPGVARSPSSHYRARHALGRARGCTTGRGQPAALDSLRRDQRGPGRGAGA